MDLKEILAISGQPGLYKFLAQSTRGVIVESLADGKRQNVPPTARVSSLAEIAVFTDAEELPLEQILQNMFRTLDGKESVSHKAPQEEIVAFFAKMVPDYDRERVHASDMKKIVSWYNALLVKGLIDLEEPKTEDMEEPEASAEKKSEKKVSEKKPAAKPKAPSAPKASSSSKAAAPKLTRGKKG